MIDEKRLDEFAQVLKAFCRFPRKPGDPEALIDGEELLRLARLELDHEKQCKTFALVVRAGNAEEAMQKSAEVLHKERDVICSWDYRIALGEWAEKYGIPALKEIYITTPEFLVASALDALPKDKEIR